MRAREEAGASSTRRVDQLYHLFDTDQRCVKPGGGGAEKNRFILLTTSPSCVLTLGFVSLRITRLGGSLARMRK